jgi:hypothetical protein
MAGTRSPINQVAMISAKAAAIVRAAAVPPIHSRSAIAWLTRSSAIARTTIATPASRPAPMSRRRSALSTS